MLPSHFWKRLPAVQNGCPPASGILLPPLQVGNLLGQGEPCLGHLSLGGEGLPTTHPCEMPQGEDTHLHLQLFPHFLQDIVMEPEEGNQ